MNHHHPSPTLWLCAGLLLAGVCPALAARHRPASETLPSLLAKHLRATVTDPAAVLSQAPIQTVYAIHAAGLEGSLTEWSAPPKRSRVEMVLGPIRQTEGDDGKIAWQQDGTGNVRIVRGSELADTRAAASFSLEDYDPIKRGTQAKVSLRPRREPGTGDYILDITPKGGTSQVLYLDPKTYLVRKMVASKGGIAGTINILAYRVVNGQRIPSRMEIGYAGLPLTVSADLVKAQRLAKVDASLFALPVPPADYEFLSSPDATIATVPFSDEYNEIILPVTINGQSHKFLLDSGAGGSFITAKAAKSLGLQSEDSLFAFGYGGAATTGFASHATVELPGGVRLKNQNLYVIKDPSVAQTLAARGGVDGALGYDLLARLTVTVDYQHKTLTLTTPSAFTAPAQDVTALPVNLEIRVPTVPARVDGKALGRFLIDTGDSGSVHLYSQYARANGLVGDPHAPNAQTQTAAGVGGLMQEVITPGHTLTLGTTTIQDVSVATTSAQGISNVSLGAGGIGNQALRRFIVTFDYAHSRILLQKPPVIASAPTALLHPTAFVAEVPSVPRSEVLGQRREGRPPAQAGSLRLAAQDFSPERQPMTTESVLARHLHALGGRTAVAAITSTHIVQTVETGGIKGRVATLYKAPDKEVEQDDLGILKTSEGYDGKNAWRRDSNGNTRMLGEDERRELRLELYIDTNSYVLPEEGIPGIVTLRPRREPLTGDYVLDLQPKDGKPSVIFLDPKTFLITKEQHLDDDVLVTTTFADYRAVDGVQFPFTQRTTNGTAKYDVVSRVTEIKNNVPAPDILFIPPLTMGKNAKFLMPGAKSASTPFNFDDGEITVPVQINGKSTQVYLDSGASGLALSQTIADALHLKQQGVLEARGYGGSTDLHPVKIDTFDIPGAVRLTDLAAVSLALPPGFDRTEVGPLAGFIGYDLLSKFVVRIDYAARKITLLDPATYQPTQADGKALPLDLDNDVPSIHAQFDGLPPAQFLLDTGDESALRLYGPYVDQNKLHEKYPKGVPSVGGGIGGESKSLLTKTQSFTVAGITLHDIPTEFSLDTKGGASQLLAGSLGSRLLSRFVVTFDYPHSRAYFAPNANAAQSFDTRTFGLSVTSVKDQQGRPHVVVIDVAADSPAAKASMAQYDQILEIDGQSVKPMSIAKIRMLLSPEGGATPRSLLLFSPQGVRRTVTITLFDPLS